MRVLLTETDYSNELANLQKLQDTLMETIKNGENATKIKLLIDESYRLIRDYEMRAVCFDNISKIEDSVFSAPNYEPKQLKPYNDIAKNKINTGEYTINECIFNNHFLVTFPEDFKIDSSDIIDFTDNVISNTILITIRENIMTDMIEKFVKCPFVNWNVSLKILNNELEAIRTRTFTNCRVEYVIEDKLSYQDGNPLTFKVCIAYDKRKVSYK